MDKELIKQLHSLAQLDRDAVSVYGEALLYVKDEEITVRFTAFQAEHQYHVDQLSAAMEELGAHRHKIHLDAMGAVADWVISVRSIFGEKGPLHAMHMAEEIHNTRYKEAAAWSVEDEKLAGKLQQFYGDEQHHLSYIDAKLAEMAK
jgi:rubrerythrin